MNFFNPDLIAKAFIILLVLYGTSLHEMAHAFVATWLGDPTPGKHGRLTFNPIPHLQPVISAVVAPILMYLTSGSLLGLATTPIDPSRFKKPLRDQALVAVAGPIMNFVFAGVMIGILWIPNVFYCDLATGEYTFLTQIFFFGALWNIILGVFNLLPLPPLDGYRIVRMVMPMELRRQVDGLMSIGPMVYMLPLILGSYLFQYIDRPLFAFYVKLLPFYRS